MITIRKFLTILLIVGINLNAFVQSATLRSGSPPGEMLSSFVNNPNALLADITKIAAGGLYTCALTTAGGVKCWGHNDDGQLGDGTTIQRNYPIFVVGMENGMKDIAVGYRHACALTDLGGVKCWGVNSTGQLGDGTTINRRIPVDAIGLDSGVVAITAGGSQSCALSIEGWIKCWGHNASGQLGDSTTNNHYLPTDMVWYGNGVYALASGYKHTCALATVAGLNCWGDNQFGELGDGTVINRSVPIQVIGADTGVVAIASGMDDTCMLTDSGGVWCWGWNLIGQVGDGTTIDRHVPTPVIGIGSGVKSISMGWSHSCAVTQNGGVKCWGENNYGQLGDFTTTQRSTPTSVIGLSERVTMTTAGRDHTCALTEFGKVMCWGSGEYGQLGNGSVSQRNIPTDVIGLPSGLRDISAGHSHTCIVTDQGSVKCWGANWSSQLGIPQGPNQSLPVNVIGLGNNINTISNGASFTCALTDEGTIKCWGENWSGQLGDGTTIRRDSPVEVNHLSGVTAIATGISHTCAIVTNGKLECWGNNIYGQLGDGTTRDRYNPTDVIGLSSGVIAIAGGALHSCALTTEGTMKCWGWNDNGQLGEGTTTQHTTPVTVVGLENGVTAMTAGSLHTCALTTTGGVKCWGSNQFGQLGDGTTNQHNIPVDVEGLTSGVMAISAGKTHTCAITNSGGVKCWGENKFGQLGNGTFITQLLPADVMGFSSGASHIATGGYHTCVLTDNGRARCWGSDVSGQLGSGIIYQFFNPVPVVSSNRSLAINYHIGQVGSFFTISGNAFSSQSEMSVLINGIILPDTFSSNASGSFVIFLNTTGANEGFYQVEVSDGDHSSVDFFMLLNDAPLQSQEGGGQVITLPPDISQDFFPLFLPVLFR